MTGHPPPPEPPIDVAVATRDLVYLESLTTSLARFGIAVRSLAPGGGADTVTLEDLDVLVLDTDSLAPTDLEWVEAVHRDRPLVEVLAIAGDSSVADAVRALRAGVFTVLQHPVADTLLAEALLAAGRRHRHARARLDALNGARHGRDTAAGSPLDQPPRRRRSS
jgi:DNA-binding NtrC family response regulator